MSAVAERKNWFAGYCYPKKGVSDILLACFAIGFDIPRAGFCLKNAVPFCTAFPFGLHSAPQGTHYGTKGRKLNALPSGTRNCAYNSAFVVNGVVSLLYFLTHQNKDTPNASAAQDVMDYNSRQPYQAIPALRHTAFAACYNPTYNSRAVARDWPASVN